MGNVIQGNVGIFHFFKQRKLSKKLLEITKNETYQNQGKIEEEKAEKGVTCFNHPAFARTNILRKIVRRIH